MARPAPGRAAAAAPAHGLPRHPAGTGAGATRSCRSRAPTRSTTTTDACTWRRAAGLAAAAARLRRADRAGARGGAGREPGRRARRGRGASVYADWLAAAGAPAGAAHRGPGRAARAPGRSGADRRGGAPLRGARRRPPRHARRPPARGARDPRRASSFRGSAASSWAPAWAGTAIGDAEAVLDYLLHHRSARFLRELVIGCHRGGDQDNARMAELLLYGSPTPAPPLRRLYLADFDDSEIDDIDISRAPLGDLSGPRRDLPAARGRGPEGPRRRRAGRAGAAAGAPVRAPHEHADPAHARARSSRRRGRSSRSSSSGSAIRRGTTARSASWTTCLPLLGEGGMIGFPRLRVLRLMNAAFADELCPLLLASPRVRALEVLDPSLGALGDAGADVLGERGRRAGPPPLAADRGVAHRRRGARAAVRVRPAGRRGPGLPGAPDPAAQAVPRHERQRVGPDRAPTAPPALAAHRAPTDPVGASGRFPCPPGVAKIGACCPFS